MPSQTGGFEGNRVHLDSQPDRLGEMARRAEQVADALEREGGATTGQTGGGPMPSWHSAWTTRGGHKRRLGD
jgi:hypothetical protein